ncbi:MAG: fumarylacetoacetate hydrolase family protein [Armatimonadetes bacterium]|nr:fumarylacetoacetate hydrolase family protein [Armatimonadota bacterium]
MKLYTFEGDPGEQQVGVEADGDLIEIPRYEGDMLALIRDGEVGWETARRALQPSYQCYPLSRVQLLPPIPRLGKILCSGLNYRSHIRENPNAVFPEDPRFFAKLPNTVIGPGAPILHPGEAYQVDYEVELAVVIGKTMFRTKEEDVMNHVFGYTILHDVSSRYIQFRDNNETMGKNFDTFAPIGPCIVTDDEIPDPSKLRLRTFLNGEVMQDHTNEDWIFPLPRLLAWLSSAMTLELGDVVTTGTPAGIGYFRHPQIFLQPGDTVTLEIEGIGRLENPVVAME